MIFSFSSKNVKQQLFLLAFLTKASNVYVITRDEYAINDTSRLKYSYRGENAHDVELIIKGPLSPLSVPDM